MILLIRFLAGDKLTEDEKVKLIMYHKWLTKQIETRL